MNLRIISFTLVIFAYASVLFSGEKRTRERFENDLYLDVDSDVVEEALANLSSLKSSKSYTQSFSLYGGSEGVLSKLQDSELSFLIPLIEEMVETIETKIGGQSGQHKILSHIAIRVDPDTSIMHRDFDRKFTMDWHAHNDDRYVFTLTEQARLSTQVRSKDKSKEEFTQINKLYLLKENVDHRTPPRRPGRRIQFSIGIIDFPKA